MEAGCSYLKSSIGRKQIVAVTGLLLILFLVGHLAGNLLIYLGEEAFNNYAKKLSSLRPGLYLIEVGLFFIFLTHVYFTALLVLENRQARPIAYQTKKYKGGTPLATRLRVLSGIFLFAFIIWHLLDFTFIDKHGPRSFFNDGISHGLYGVVVNSFRDPIHSLLYVLAMMSLGLHLSHGVQSFIQTFGLNTPASATLIKKLSDVFAVCIALAYSSIPLFILLSKI
jgi:succinate dehydrogenase / fumarate reductase cytochrome b subunit